MALCDLPDLVLVHILKFIELQELLLNVCKVNKKLYNIVNQTSFLWKIVEFEFPLDLQQEDLEHIFTHSVGIRMFHIPCATLHIPSNELDFLFTTRLSIANLYSLDITGCRVSTLCFLKCFKNLHELNISECPNLVDEDLEAVRSLMQLESLYTSFTKIEPDTIVSVCSSLPNLKLLDVSGIQLTIEHCANILTDHLQYFYLSLESDEDESWFCGLARRYRNLSTHIYRTYN